MTYELRGVCSFTGGTLSEVGHTRHTARDLTIHGSSMTT